MQLREKEKKYYQLVVDIDFYSPVDCVDVAVPVVDIVVPVVVTAVGDVIPVVLTAVGDVVPVVVTAVGDVVPVGIPKKPIIQ